MSLNVAACTHQPPQPLNGEDEAVVLLHGLGRGPMSMKKMQKSMARAGYTVVNLSYASTKYPIHTLARHVAAQLAKCCAQAKLHFVTHSLGGIVVRQMLKDNPGFDAGRIVMLAPPNQGSELADHLKDNMIYRKLLGPTGQQLGTGADSVPNLLGPVGFELGVIIGNRTLNPWFSSIIPGPDDGKVSVKRAKIAGMKDFLQVPYSHTYVMWRKPVINQTIHFIKHGYFKH